ncbi:hypothetical protein C0J52_21628 [Blattella germanica]|nr:hypothetical protein C0J52_21628 [Blattella germanica]
MTVAAMVFSFYALGLIYLAIGFSYEKNWRKYLYIHVAFLPTVLLYFILPESTRWLKVKGKEKRLIKELLRLAKLKGIEMKAENLDKFRATDRNKEVLRTKIDDRFVEVHQKEEENKSDEQDLKETEEGGDSIKISSNISMPLDQESQIKPVKLKKTEILPNSKLKIKPPSLLRILRSKVLVLRFFTCLLTWTILAFVYTTSLTSVDKFRYGDKYANFLLSSMVEIPAYFLTPVMSADFGRKKLLAGTLLVNSVLFIILALVSNSDMLKTGMVIKHVILIGNTLAYAVVSILTIELFPTNWRQTIFCICCAISRIGQPTYHLWIPVYFVNTELYLFGGFSLATGILVLFMPETAEENLPDTVEEAEALTIKHGKFWFTKSKSKFY